MRINRDKDVLLVIDMQNDHVSGTLEHPGAASLIEPINLMAEKFDHVIIVKDWHTPDHVSFAASHPELAGQPRGTVRTHYGDQFAAAPHCVQGSYGAELDPGFRLSKAELEFRKGYRRDTDSYSAFHMNDGTPTGLAELLRVRGYTRVFGVGVGQYGCVGHSLEGAVKEGFAAVMLDDGCKQNWGYRANTRDECEAMTAAARAELAQRGVQFGDSSTLVGEDA